MELERGVVYIVDDDPSVRRSIERLAQSMGLEAQGFATGADFLAARKGARRACVVLDQRLPDMHGLELQRRLARTDPGLPVVVITAYGDDFVRAEAPAGDAVTSTAHQVDHTSNRGDQCW